MTSVQQSARVSIAWQSGQWLSLADRVLAGHAIDENEALAILRCGDEELLELLAAAYRVRHRRHGNRVHLNLLINAKSGACGEDCGYCSQSRVSTADIPRYGLLDPRQILAGARTAAERRAKTYCIVVSGRGPSDRELDAVADAVRQIKAEWPLKVCVSPGLLTLAQAQHLRQCGVDRVNHNLNSSERFYPRICTTHAYQDRLDTLAAVREAGMEICCGGIVGMGEEDADVVELALRVGRLRAEAVPVNFYQPIPGTPLGEEMGTGSEPATQRVSHGSCGEAPVPISSPGAHSRLTPQYCLKVLALFRLANPACELRIAAGREVHLRTLQPLGLFAADSIFVGDYLTTKGRPPEDDFRMIADLGFEPVIEG